MAQLPAPGTRTEEFLAAVVDELRGLRADLEARGGKRVTPDIPGRTELREPTTAPRSVSGVTPESRRGRRKS